MAELQRKIRSSNSFEITGAHLRAARALLRWSAQDLAMRSRLGIATVRRAEAQDGRLTVTPANAQALKSALEAGGIVFIPANGGGIGVRLKS